jgi:hypothetical protein
MQVRAAGSILKAHARRGRRVALVVNAAGRETVGVRDDEGDWRRALETLAAVQPDGRTPVATLLSEGTAAGRALDLAVVTAQLPADLVERIAQRASARRGISVVYVDAPTFAGRRPRALPELLRLDALGVPTTTLRRGDDLAAKLGGVAEAVGA